jgi:hypothetical protein
MPISMIRRRREMLTLGRGEKETLELHLIHEPIDRQVNVLQIIA